MTVKELKQAITAMDDELEVVIMECKKHEDNAPLMPIEAVEQVTTDDDEVCLISMQPNPQTINENMAVRFAFWTRDNAIAVANGAWIHDKKPYDTATLFLIFKAHDLLTTPTN